jgi:hypothetical protein
MTLLAGGKQPNPGRTARLPSSTLRHELYTIADEAETKAPPGRLARTHADHVAWTVRGCSTTLT